MRAPQVCCRQEAELQAAKAVSEELAETRSLLGAAEKRAADAEDANERSASLIDGAEARIAAADQRASVAEARARESRKASERMSKWESSYREANAELSEVKSRLEDSVAEVAALKEHEAVVQYRNSMRDRLGESRQSSGRSSPYNLASPAAERISRIAANYPHSPRTFGGITTADGPAASPPASSSPMNGKPTPPPSMARGPQKYSPNHAHDV